MVNEFDGATDWTGSLSGSSNGQVQRRLENLERKWAAHLFLDAWQSNQEFPHPNQSISTLLFFEGNGRLNTENGFQIVAPFGASEVPGISWQPELSQDADPIWPNVRMLTSLDQSPVGEYSAFGTFQAEAEETLYEASIRVRSLSDGTAGGPANIVQMRANGFPSTAITATLTGDPVASTGHFTIANGPLGLPASPSDFSNLTVDGMLQYRTDTDVIRARINGVTVDLLHTGSVIPVVLTSLDLPYTSVAVNTLTTSTQTFIDVDASGASRTITLPSAATLTSGFTYVIRKLDATNNTVTIDPNGAQSVNGQPTYTLYKQYDVLTAVSNGANWNIWGTYEAPASGYVTRTAAYTALPTDTLIACDMTSGAYSVTLAPAASCTGRTLTIIKTDTTANVCTVDGNAAETVNGVVTVGLSTQYQSFTLFSTGAAWLIIGST